MRPISQEIRALSLLELVAFIAIVAIFIFLLRAGFPREGKTARLSEALQKAKQMAVAMTLYANDHDGMFPQYIQHDPSKPLANSNQALEELMPKYLTDKKLFSNFRSAWCKSQKENANTQYQILAGQNDWAYLTNLSDKSDARWPLCVTAPAPGRLEYVSDVQLPGGVWKGENAHVIHADASVTQETLKGPTDARYIPRPDNPNLTMLKPDGDWLKETTFLFPQ